MFDYLENPKKYIKGTNMVPPPPNPPPRPAPPPPRGRRTSNLSAPDWKSRSGGGGRGAGAVGGAGWAGGVGAERWHQAGFWPTILAFGRRLPYAPPSPGPH
jgi:hypothetical protein